MHVQDVELGILQGFAKVPESCEPRDPVAGSSERSWLWPGRMFDRTEPTYHDILRGTLNR